MSTYFSKENYRNKAQLWPVGEHAPRNQELLRVGYPISGALRTFKRSSQNGEGSVFLAKYLA